MRRIEVKNHRIKTVDLTVELICRFFLTNLTVFGFILFAQIACAKTFFLDNNLTANCTGNYSIANRTCNGSDGDAYCALAGALGVLSGGDVLYVRSGTYIRQTNSEDVGALHINKSGTPGAHTIVRAYQREQPIICTAAGKCQYNPVPGDTSGVNSSHYYPNPAIYITGNYIDVLGFKTYGQAVIHTAHDILLRDCDLGGGGPHTNQGQTLAIYSSYAVTVGNNLIHNSCWGESQANGSALMGYDFAATIENNEFYDNYGADIRLKDLGQTNQDHVTIRYNFFRPSALANNAGVQGCAQDCQVPYVYVYQNIFYQKDVGILWDYSAAISTIAYNNTFVDCKSDIYDWMDNTKYAYNNLHYHSTGTNVYNCNYEGTNFANITSNFNLFYASGVSPTWKSKTVSTGNYSTWKTYKDSNSVSGANPGFVNAIGASPEDFRRSSYVGDVQNGSPYGTMCGAYKNGNETIGVGGIRAPVQLRIVNY